MKNKRYRPMTPRENMWDIFKVLCVLGLVILWFVLVAYSAYKESREPRRSPLVILIY